MVCYKKYLYVLCLLFVVCWIDMGFGMLLMCFVDFVDGIVYELMVCVEFDVLFVLKMSVNESEYGLCWLVIYVLVEMMFVDVEYDCEYKWLWGDVVMFDVFLCDVVDG